MVPVVLFVPLEILKDVPSDGKEVPLLRSRTAKFCKGSFNVVKGRTRAIVVANLLDVTFFVLNLFEDVPSKGEVVGLPLARPEIGHVVVAVAAVAVIVAVCGGGDGLI